MTGGLGPAVRRAMDEALNGRNLDGLDAVFATDMADRSIAHAAGQEGLAGFKQRLASHWLGLPDLRSEIFEVVEQGDLVAFRWRFSGTHTGPWLGRQPTGKSVVLEGMNLERFEDGKVVEHFSYPNLLGLFRQMDAP